MGLPLFFTILLVSWLLLASPAWAWIVISDGPGGGSCTTVGTWDSSTKTCTLTTDITFHSTPNDGFSIASDNITLDGNGHILTGYDRASGDLGLSFSGRNGVTIKNLVVREFSTAIYGNNAGTSSSNVISGNWLYHNEAGIGLNSSSQVQVIGNMIFSNNNIGIQLGTTSNCSLTNNFFDNQTYGAYITLGDDNFISGNTFSGSDLGLGLNADNDTVVVFNNFATNIAQATLLGGSSNTFMYNHWDDYDAPDEGCLNTSPFDFACDAPYSPAGGGFSDTIAFLWPSGWSSYYSTWYDDIGGNNWVLIANPNSASDIWADLYIGGMAVGLPRLEDYASGQIPPGAIVYAKYPGLMGGPVVASGRSVTPNPVVSQRTLWPKGGNSFEEVPGISALNLSNQYWWTWYDMQSPGYKDWVLISNPNAFDVYAVVVLAGELIWDDVVPAGGQTNLQFPGEMGGPLMVRGYVSGSSDPANIMASQRVLSNSDTAFNELPGIPSDNLSSDYLWTWYDMTGGAINWVLIANPDTNFPNDIYYQIKIAGDTVANGGPVAAGDTEARVFPGTMGGPVEVLTSFDEAHHLPAPSIVSQRSLWGPSFEEVPGARRSGLQPSYEWTWYDEVSAGALNWVLIANPSNTETITAYISFPDQVSGIPQLYWDVIPPGGKITPRFPGRMGGPVKVWAYLYGTTSPRPVLTSQRVLWNGFFNEVWGQ